MKLSRYKREYNYSYAFGATLVLELIKTHPELITRVFLRPNLEKQGDKLTEIISSLRQNGINIIETTKAFNVLGAKENCLLIAEFNKPQNSIDCDKGTPHVVLVNPSDAGNLGTIMRSAVAFGHENIAIISPSVDPYDPKTIRASMGAIFHLNIASFSSIKEYQNSNLARQLYAFMLNSTAQTLSEVLPNNNHYSIVFGNEASGLPTNFCNETGAKAIYIPQSPNVDSLNLSVAASIAMYTFSHKK